MPTFARLNNQNTVCQVIKADSLEWCEENLGGRWVRNYRNVEGKNYAGIGYLYHEDLDNFSEPQPYESWTMDDKLMWQPPVPLPDLDNYYVWDEVNKKWNLYNG